MVVWEDAEGLLEQLIDGDAKHARLSYEQIEASGPAARPLEFPTPKVDRGARCIVTALDHRTGRLYPVKNVLMTIESPQPQRSYLIRKTIARSEYGCVKSAVVLKRRNLPPLPANGRRRQSYGMVLDEEAEWESTEEVVAIKVSSWASIRHMRGRHLEDPVKEIAALQLLGSYHPHVIGALEILQDDDYLFVVMPYCSGGDLFGRIMEKKEPSPSNYKGQTTPSGLYAPTRMGVSEDHARIWFQQLLSALFHLQQKGVCHRDISLDNIVVDENDHLVLIDLGMALRVPYSDPANAGVTDVSEGTDRRLIQAQGQGGKLMYLAPEVVARDEEFDGFAIDLWAAGVVLFVLLVGLAPFKWAHPSDKRYAKIREGQLGELMRILQIPLSADVVNMLQNMFWRDPSKRLTLSQVMQHPWVLDKKLPVPAAKPPKIHSLKSAMPLRGVVPL